MGECQATQLDPSYSKAWARLAGVEDVGLPYCYILLP